MPVSPAVDWAGPIATVEHNRQHSPDHLSGKVGRDPPQEGDTVFTVQPFVPATCVSGPQCQANEHAAVRDRSRRSSLLRQPVKVMIIIIMIINLIYIAQFDTNGILTALNMLTPGQPVLVLALGH